MMDIVGVQNVRSADRFLGAPTLQSTEQIHSMGHSAAVLLLRQFASEQTRWYAEQWEWTQLAIGLGLLLLLVFGNRPPKVAIGLCLLMLAIVLIDRLSLTPWMDHLGREVDSLPAGAQLPATFTLLRRAHSIMEVVKLSLGAGMAGLLLLRKPADLRMFARESEMEQGALPRRSAK